MTPYNPAESRAVVGISGGVDSAVAAHLLLSLGYDVTGVTIAVSENTDVAGAADVCRFLGVKHIIADYSEEFRKRVVSRFTDEYSRGKTPNPCVLCNPLIKWDALLREADKTGAFYAATGHYCEIKRLPSGRFAVFASKNDKDQSYVLYGLSQSQLSRALTPLGAMTKRETREIAAEIGLPCADKPDSQDICFINGGSAADFIIKTTGITPERGDFINTDGKKIGEHKGLAYYTVGQRKGLGMSFGRHMFVKKIIAERNEIMLCDEDELFEKEVFAESLTFMAIETLNEGEEIKAMAKLRYGQKAAPCAAHMENGRLACVFDEPQRAPAPGQSVVLYDKMDGYIICGGIICQR